MKKLQTLLQTLHVMMQSAKNFFRKVTRFYEQGASPKRTQAYRLRWLAWAMLAIPTLGFSVALDQVTTDEDMSSCESSTGEGIYPCGKVLKYGTSNVVQREDTTRSFLYRCETEWGAAADDGVTQAGYDSVVEAKGEILLEKLETRNSGGYLKRHATDLNGLYSTPTFCVRAETSSLDAEIPDNSFRVSVFPPNIQKDDASVMSPQLIPDAPIDVACDGKVTYSTCYEKARIVFNKASCNEGGAGSCGHTTLSSGNSLTTTLEPAKNYVAGVVRPVDMSVSANSGSETDITTITVTATAAAAVIGEQTVTVSVSGTGITAEDYTLSKTTLTIADGTTTGTVNFSVADDAATEGSEVATITFSNPSAGVGLGEATTANITITDNDNATQQTVNEATLDLDKGKLVSLETDDPNNYTTGQPIGMTFDLGTFKFAIDDLSTTSPDTIRVSFTLASDIPENAVMYKINSTGYTQLSVATHGLTISGKTFSYNITDNGPLDTDPVLGKIVDPVTVGVPSSKTTTSAGSGSLSLGWLLLLGLFLMGLIYLRRKQTDV